MLLFSLRPPTDTKLRAAGRVRHNNNLPILGLEELPLLTRHCPLVRRSKVVKSEVLRTCQASDQHGRC